MLALSRGDVITQGLALAGRPDLLADARLWLNMFLENYYQSQDASWLVKSANVSVTEGVAFPSDYRASKSGLIITDTGKVPIEIFDDPAKYDFFRLSSTTGVPTIVWADNTTRTFKFLPLPDQVYTLALKYYYYPAYLDHDDAADDASTFTWGAPYDILIDYIKARAMEYNDDERQDKASENVLKKIAQSKMNDHDRRGGSSRMAMGKSFRKRFK